MADDEKIILQGTPQELMALIPQVTAVYQLLKSKDVGNIYGIPSQDFHEVVKFKPQVTLFFEQRAVDVDPLLGAIRAKISFRILNETPKTMSPAKALALAKKINQLFGSATPFSWSRGKHLFSYDRPDKGVQTRIYTTTKSEAKRIVGQVLDIQNISTDWDYLKDCSKIADLESPANGDSGKELIYGESRKLPRHLPTGSVKFTYAEMYLHGLPNAVILVDLTGTKKNPLVRS